MLSARACSASAITAAAAPKRFGNESHRVSEPGPPPLPPVASPTAAGLATNTAILSLNAAGSRAVESPHRPAKTVGTSVRLAEKPSPLNPLGTTGSQSERSVARAPEAMSRNDALSKPIGPYGSSWKYVPLSPAGLRPSRWNSRAMYVVPLKFPTLPMRRPCIESSENGYSRERRSFAVIALVVGRGVHVAGPSSGQTIASALRAVDGFELCAPTLATAASDRTSARRMRDDAVVGIT